MLLRISCPKCGKQLNTPPELVGEIVACPSCANRFRVRRSDVSEPSNPKTSPPSNPDLYPPGAAPTARRASPSAAASTPAAPPKAAPASRSAPNHPTAQASVGKQTRTARFIERDPNATPVKLGADGQLPDLALSTQEKRHDATDRTKSANPLLLIGVLCISVVMSVLILVVDEPAPGVSRGKSEARHSLRQVFNAWDRINPPDLEIRDLLAHAFRAYNRGDAKREEVYYRQVMDLLNREDAPKYGGYTGDDETLKEALTELLR